MYSECYLLINARCRVQSLYNSPLPDPLGQIVTEFQTYLKKQKEISNQFGKFSDSSFKEVKQKISTQRQVSTECS